MFETGINLWLQSMASPLVTTVLTGVTFLGYLPVYAVLLVTLTFGVRVRLGLAVLGAVLLTGIATEAAKKAVAFPRPDQVDDRLMRTGASFGEAIVPRGGASGFWSLPDAAVIESVRAELQRRNRDDFGFPSGHVSAATAFLVAAAWSVRVRRLYVVAALWVLLMALSRLYLGRHFLADVVGGFILGLVVSMASLRLLPPLDRTEGMRPNRRALAGVWILSLGLLALMPVWPPLPPRYVGAFCGLAISKVVILVIEDPFDGGTRRERALRVLLALALFAVTLAATERALTLAGRSDARWSQVLAGLIVTASTFGGAIALCRRLRLYPDTRPVDP